MRKVKRLLKIAVAGAAALVLISGCAQQQKTDSTEQFIEKWKARAEESRSYSPGAARPAPELKDPEKGTAAKASERKVEPEREKPLPAKRISLKMSNVDVTTLLRALARAADVNIILNDKITGRSNINITQAPWDQVFLGILRTHNLTYAWQGDIVRIMTADDLEDELRKESRRRELLLAESPVTRIVPVKFAAAEKLQENMKSFLSMDKANKPIGSVLVDQHTNSLIISALPRDLNAILDVVEKLDKPIPQILIEAYIVEANKDVARDLGVQWGGVLQLSGGDRRGFLTGRDNTALGQNVDTGVNPNSGNVVNLPLSAASATSFGLIYQNVGKALLAAQLTALQEEGKLTILSNPSITTLDNQPAMIESGSEIPFQTVEDGEVNIEYKSAVLRLDVTPHVIDQDQIKLAVKVKKDEPLSGRNLEVTNPIILTKKAETSVVQFDGQTLVIGGLNKETATDSRSGTPWLLDIPVLGWLFKTQGKSNTKDDLLIFITPTILKHQTSPPAGRQ